MSLASASTTGPDAAGSTDGRLTYVIDTSVLLSDPHALRRFAEHDVVLPLVVVTELEGKRDHPELGFFARTALRHLDDLRVRHGRLDAPVPANDEGGTLHVELNHTDPKALPEGFRLGDNDARILAVALNYAVEGRDVTLVSKDLPMRVKAASVGLRAEEYRAELAVSSGWTGMVELDATSAELDALYESGTLDPSTGSGQAPSTGSGRGLEAARDLPCHTGVVLLGASSTALARVTPSKELRLIKDRDAFGVHGRSAEQRVALDLLLDPSIGIVSLGGRAPARASRPSRCAPGSRPCSNVASTRRSSCSARCTRWAGRTSATSPARRGRRWRPGRRPSSTPSEPSPPRSSSRRSWTGACSRSCR